MSIIPDPAVTDWIPLGNMPPAFVSGMVPLGDVIVPSGGQATIDFQNIDQSFAHLMIQASLRGDNAATSVTLGIRFNGDSSAVYYDVWMQNSAASFVGGEHGASPATQSDAGFMVAAGGLAGWYSVHTIHLNDYAAAKPQNFTAVTHGMWNSGSGNHAIRVAGGSRGSAASTNRITLVPGAGNFVAGSRATLYGVSATPQPVGGASIIPRLTSGQMSALVPFDGQVIDLIADATNGINWRLRYNANSASAYKWEFVGGPPMLSDVQTLEAFAGTNAYGACPTDGPAIIVPRAGDYVAQFNAESYNTISPGTNWISPKHGAAGTSDNDSSVSYLPSGSTSLATHYRSLWLTALPASTDIHMYYKVSTTANTGNFRKRELRVTPIRVS
jgi:hypothetical protein